MALVFYMGKYWPLFIFYHFPQKALIHIGGFTKLHFKKMSFNAQCWTANDLILHGTAVNK